MKLEIADTSTAEQLDSELFTGEVCITHSGQNGLLRLGIEADADKLVVKVLHSDEHHSSIPNKPRFPKGTFKVYNWSDHLPSGTEEAFGIVALQFRAWLHSIY